MGICLLGLLLLFILALVSEGDLGMWGLAGVEVVPFLALAVLTYLGAAHPWARVLGGVWLWLLLITVVISNAVSVHLALEKSAAPHELITELVPGTKVAPGMAWLLSMGAILLARLLTSRRARRLWSRAVPVDPDSRLHHVAIFATLALSLLMVVPLLVLEQPPFLLMLDLEEAGPTDQLDLLKQQFYPLIWLIPGAFVAVGYGIVRNGRQALYRLGLVAVNPLQGCKALGLGVLFAGVIVLTGPVLEKLWQATGLPATDSTGLEQLFAAMMTPAGVIAVSISAGIGEELAFRGVLQPRLGILLSNLLFTTIHAYQYHLDGLLVVFLLGLMLALLRRRGSILPSIIAHSAYDLVLLVLALMATGGAGP